MTTGLNLYTLVNIELIYLSEAALSQTCPDLLLQYPTIMFEQDTERHELLHLKQRITSSLDRLIRLGGAESNPSCSKCVLKVMVCKMQR